MGDMLSQAEIDALLGGGGTSDSSSSISEVSENLPELEFPGGDAALEQDTGAQQSSAGGLSDEELQNILTSEQKDVLGEIGNISMGTAATTLFALLNQKVMINTPRVNVKLWRQLTEGYDRPCVGVRVDYKEGFRGSNILILKQHDVKVITSLMMGGDGLPGEDLELTDIDLSAIGEAMNQMVGSSSTSLASMIKRKVDIDTPHAFLLDFTNDDFFTTVGFLPDDVIVCISFRMQVGDLLDSEIMQILPVEFAEEMVHMLQTEVFGATTEPEQQITFETSKPPSAPQVAQQDAQPQMVPLDMQPQMAPLDMQPQMPPPGMQPQMPPPGMQPQMPPPGMQSQMPTPGMQSQMMTPEMQQQMQYQYQYYQYPPQYAPPPQQNINVQPVQFQAFDASGTNQQKENIDIIMDVPLEVSVELGRTHKKIKEILEFSPGTVVELDKLAGEPIDILVNGKFVAKGEVVVIDENFGIRITNIISAEDRI